MRRVLITGSREWTDRERLESVLWYEMDRHPDTVFVHGDCPRGADRMVREACIRLGYQQEPHPADWDRHKKAAGFIRNAEMVKLGADLCIAFIVPGKSNGTEHTATLARSAGIEVCEVRSE